MSELVVYGRKADTGEVFEINTLESATDRIKQLKMSWLGILLFPVDLSRFWRLESVDLSRNNLTNLPNLVCLPNLETLVVDNNHLMALPELPERLQTLNCNDNHLAKLPELPPTLKKLYCVNNRLTKLPELPPTLEQLYCCHNQLSLLPKFPSTLKMIYCEFNRLKQIPLLNERLIGIHCSNNELTRIPYTNPSLMQLKCCHNRIISIQFHDGVVWMDFKNNPVFRVLQYHTRRNVDQRYKLKVIDVFNRTYYGGKLREFIFRRCLEPFVRRKYHPDRLRERLAQCDEEDEEAFQRVLLTW